MRELSINKDEPFLEFSKVINHSKNLRKNNLCLCGHNISTIYYVKNEKTDDIIQLGSCCVKKIGKNMIKDYNKEYENYCEFCNVKYTNKEKHKKTKK